MASRPAARRQVDSPPSADHPAALTELAFARAQQRALEMIAAGKPLSEILEHIVATIELRSEGMRGSVVLLEDGVHIRPGVAPRLPREYTSSFDGFPISAVAGSCGTAMWRGERVVVADITQSELWAPYAAVVEIATAAGLRACWSTPLRASTGRIVGSFAMYYGEPREPTSEELQLADIAGHLCGLAVEHAFTYAKIRRREAEQAAVAAIGQLAVRSGEEERLMSELVEAVTSVLPESKAALFALGPTGERRLRAASGWPADEAGNEEPQMSVEIPGCASAWGVLEVRSPAAPSWGDEETAFLKSLASLLSSAVQRSHREHQLRHQALHDPLTGLPNRSLLSSLLEHALESERRRGATVAVLLLDLDNFKLINDSLGHLAGDSLLAAVAPRLRRVVRKADVLARFGGDEFVVIAGHLTGERQALAVAERIRRALSRPFIVEGAAHTVSASIGIALAPAGRGDADALLRDADAAMFEAKRHGGGAHKVFDTDMNDRSVSRLRLVTELRGALERDELSLAFQPIVPLCPGAPAGAEALMRWNAPAGRGRPIPEVIAAAEESGLIQPLGAFAIDRALEVLAQGGIGDYVSVNLSPRQVACGDVAALVKRLLEQHAIEPGRLVLEITETVLFDETGASTQTIGTLHELGVRLALDDFGTGFSSLQHLLRFPIDVLKIDRAFIARLPDDRRARAIISSVTAMAHELDKRVVAEGIETEAQLESVRELGCDLGQGFLLGRPGPPPA